MGAWIASVRKASPSLSSARDRPESLQNFGRVRSDRLAYHQKFDDVEATFATFIFRYKRLRLVKPFREFMLSEAGVLSGLDHKRRKGVLAFRMNRFVKFARASCHRRGTLIRSSDYPKTGLN